MNMEVSLLNMVIPDETLRVCKEEWEAALKETPLMSEVISFEEYCQEVQLDCLAQLTS